MERTSLKIDSVLENISLEQKDVMLQTPLGQYYKQIISLLHPEIKFKIVLLLNQNPDADPEELFVHHREIVTLLEHYGYPLKIEEIERLEELYQVESTENDKVQLLLWGCHPKYNAGTYLAYFNEWQLNEFLQAIIDTD